MTPRARGSMVWREMELPFLFLSPLEEIQGDRTVGSVHQGKTLGSAVRFPREFRPRWIPAWGTTFDMLLPGCPGFLEDSL
jgi:hypothetical protein